MRQLGQIFPFNLLTNRTFWKNSSNKVKNKWKKIYNWQDWKGIALMRDSWKQANICKQRRIPLMIKRLLTQSMRVGQSQNNDRSLIFSIDDNLLIIFNNKR